MRAVPVLRALLCLLFGAVAGSCVEQPSPSIELDRATDRAPGWTEGRSLTVTVRGAEADMGSRVLSISSGDLAALESALEGDCRGAARVRFADTQNQSQACALEGAQAQLAGLCAGHAFMRFAQTLGSIDVSPRGHITERRPDAEAAVDTQWTLAPPDNQQRTTLALRAAEHYRSAAEDGAGALDPELCRTGLDADLPGGVAVGEGLSDDPSDRVTLADVLAVQAAETIAGLSDAEALARRGILASARAARSEELDEREGLTQLWRGRHGSRLEAASLLVGAPARAFEASIEDDPDEMRGDYPIVADRPRSEAARRAESLLRALRINPRERGDALYATAVAALIEDEPAAFADLDTTDPRAALESIRVSPAELDRAAARIVEELVVRGGTLVELPRERDRVVRVAGTDAAARSLRPSVVAARTAGARYADDVGARFGGSLAPDPRYHGPSPTYAQRSVLGAIDALAVAADRASTRPDTGPRAAVRLRLAVATVRERVPMRMEVAVGQPDARSGMPDRARVRLYGADPARSYTLWVGHAGLQCGLTGAVEGEPCDAEDYQVPIEPRELMNGESSGLGARYLEWDIPRLRIDNGPNSMTGGGGDVGSARAPLVSDPFGGHHVFAVADPSAGDSGGGLGADFGVEVAGFDVSAGPASTTEFSRVTHVTAGSAVLDDLGDVLGVGIEDAFEPLVTCAGTPHDQRIALEDELIGNGDQTESSFQHYLVQAQRAAARADELGERLLNQGQQMTERAESAREELERLCGGVVNLESLLPDTCMADDECPPGIMCHEGTCLFANLEQLVQASGSEDLESVRRCLALPSSEELGSASLGDEALCVWRHVDVPSVTCGCPTGLDCPPCGVVAADHVAACPDYTAEFGPGFANELTQSLSLVIASSIPPPPQPLDCVELAQVRHGIGPSGWNNSVYETAVGSEGLPMFSNPDVLQDVLSSSHLNLTEARRAARLIGFHSGLFGSARVTRGGRDWIVPVSETSGPNTDQFPSVAWHTGSSSAAALLGEICSHPGQVGDSFLCGDAAPAEAHARRLYRALHALNWLTSNVTTGIYAPVASRWAEMDEFVRDDNLFAEWRYIDSELGSLGSTAFDCSWTGNARSMDANSSSTLTTSVTPAWFDLPIGLTANVEQFVHPTYGVQRCIVAPDNQDISPDACLAAQGAVCPLALHERRVDIHPNHVLSSAQEANLWRVEALAEDDFTIRQQLSAAHVALSPIGLGFAPPGGDPPYHISGSTLFDALELSCIGQEGSSTVSLSCAEMLSNPPPIESEQDFDLLAELLECAAAQIGEGIGTMILTDLPGVVLDDLASGGASALFPTVRGEYGTAVADIRGQLESLAAQIGHIARILRVLSTAMDTVQNELALLDNQESIGDLRLGSTISNQLAECAVSIANIWDLNVANVPGRLAASVLTCANSATQIGLATAINDLEEGSLELQRQNIYIRLGETAAQQGDAMQDIQSATNQSYAQLQGALARLDTIRSSARRAAARALLLESDVQVGREFRTNSVLRSRYSETARRYEAARSDAVRKAFIARRALEQRLGVDLSTLEGEFGALPAPATWADSVCELQGLDFEALADSIPAAATHPCGGDGYVGDYVSCLETFLDEYRLAFPFQNNDRDVAVVSLRDDVHQVRDECLVEGPNFLLHSLDPNVVAAPCIDEACSTTGWWPRCDNGSYCLSQNNVGASPFGASAAGSAGTLHAPTAYRLRYAQKLGATPRPPSPATAPTWTQEVVLPPGAYVLSWYERLAALDVDALACDGDGVVIDGVTAPAETLLAPSAAGLVAPLTVEPLGNHYGAPCSEALLAAGWRRAFAFVQTPVQQTVVIGLRPRSLDANAIVTWAAPQLEAGTDHPTRFFPTGADYSASLPVCEDTDGDVFRSGQHWIRECEEVCSSGNPNGCPAGTPTTERCFWQTQFGISLDDIERGDLIPSGNFAVGNFNYRYNDFSVNLVGVGVRDCEGVDSPSTCYASGFVPFSLRHDGPYTVRNHLGELYEAPLFVGNIEHGKALAAERYLTNPLSNADRSLLTDYWHRELRGRPLDGNYTLRIYDAPGLRWENLEDIQIAFRYRYWTRFE